MIDLTRLPVIIGSGQHTNRITDPASAPGPYDMLETVATDACADAGDKALLARLSDVWVVNALTFADDPDPAGELTRRLGCRDARPRNSGTGGATPQWLVSRAAERVLQGERPIALIAGMEALATRKRMAKEGALDNMLSNMERSVEGGSPRAATADTFPPMESDPGVHPLELAHGLGLPTHMYALSESSVAHEQGHDPAAHRSHMGELLARFNRVAAENPYAWFPTPRDAVEIVTPSPSNRWICFPYTKYMCAIMDVDMAAAVIVTDAQTARDLGLAESDVAYVSGWAEATDVRYVSERPLPANSPAIAECGRVALRMAAADVDDVTAFDIYAAFPSSVEVGLRALGVGQDDPRPLTLTGGLAYHGGAGNNYVSHSIANAFHHVRDGDDETALVHGNGYFITKHSVGVYRSQPPTDLPEPDEAVQARVDAAAPPIPLDAAAEGRGTVVAYTVDYDRDGAPGDAIVVVSIDGRRAVAIADDDLRSALLERDCVNQPVRVTRGHPRNRVFAD